MPKIGGNHKDDAQKRVKFKSLFLTNFQCLLKMTTFRALQFKLLNLGVSLLKYHVIIYCFISEN